MSMYIENNLGKDEEIILKAKKSFLYLVGPLLWAVIVLVLAIVANVLVAPYASPKGMYIQSQLAEAMQEFDENTKDMDSAEKEEGLSDSDAIAMMEHYIGRRNKYTWSDYRNAVSKLYEEEIEQHWEAEKDEYMERLNAEGGFRKIVVNAGSYAAILIWVLFFLCGFVPFLKRLLKWLSINLALTNKRVVGKVGILRINALDFHLDKIDHVQIKGTILGNLFHYYSLRIVSVGGAGFDNNRRRKKDADQFVGISNAQEFKDMATRAIELHAEEARRAQAAEIARAMGK